MQIRRPRVAAPPTTWLRKLTVRNAGISNELDYPEAKALAQVQARICGLDHNKIYTAFFKGTIRKTIPRHLLDLVPVLTQIAGSLLLGRKFGLEAASLATISICDLKKDRLITLYSNFGISWQTVAHRLFLRETLALMLGSPHHEPTMRRYYVSDRTFAWNKDDACPHLSTNLKR